MLLVAKNIISDSNLFFYLYNFSQSTTFEYNSIEYHYPEEYFGNSIYVEEPFEITDVNFDGFDDILIYLGSYGNRKRQFSRIIQN